MIQRLMARPVEKPEWGSTQLEPWFRNSERKIGEMWFEGPAGSPLLIKFLFTTAALSVQVHPDDAYAEKHHAIPGQVVRGKTEMWHILRAEPGARIAAGFREPVTPQQIRSAAISGEIEDLLEWYEAHPGDTFFIPAGTVHAIGAGLVLCEIQQTSDITYRLYDYGRPRELHLDQGVSVSHTGRHAARQRSGQEVLVECPFFTTQRHSISGQRTLTAVGRAHTLIVLEGEGEVGSEGARAGDVFYVSTGTAPVTVRGELTLLRTFS